MRYSIVSGDCWVDTRDTLRRFLEQRRESGETELVLDSLSVDEALRLIGVRGALESQKPVPPMPHGGSPPAAEQGHPREAVASPRETGGGMVDWRSILRGHDRSERTEVESVPQPAESQVHTDLRRGVLSASAIPVESRSGRTGAPVTPPDSVPGIVVGGSGSELFTADSPYASLEEIERAVASCQRCSLFREAKHPVPGVGNPVAELVCVGEAPGATEDEMGLPFVGQAGQLLTRILAAIDLSREDVFICNVLKHRPPGNRNPQPSEVEACSPYLLRQIELIRPKVIVALGTFAAQTLLETKESIGKLRGRIHRYHGIPLVVTYHPAALLRNPAWKRPTWEDVQLARQLLDRAGSGR
ncbi:MAG: hypothetical protein MNPFHGCM_01022 [Gemmatimonadaceae bacterium]|nr:hypothetical protein [Gemmatimonadaceae bacterium]